MQDSVKYTNDEFLKFYDRQGKTIDALDRIIDKCKAKDKIMTRKLEEYLNLGSGFEISFDGESISAVYTIKVPNITAFYQVKLKILDKESGKDISRNTHFCGIIVNGRPSKEFEIKQFKG